jgi:hypothetical protein
MQTRHDTPDAKELRTFGLTIAVGLCAVLGLLMPWLSGGPRPVWPWVAGLLIAACGLAAPMLLKPAYRGWMTFARLLEWINTRILLGIVFILVVIPIGVLKRVLGGDAMNRAFDHGADSYRIKKKAPSGNQLGRPY